MKKINCPFLNISNTEEYPHPSLIRFKSHRSPYLGDYFITDSALREINEYINKVKIKNLNSTQALINCAYKILSANQRGASPNLLTNLEFQNFKDNLSSLPNFINKEALAINLEETMKESVDHTSKVLALLIEMSKQTLDKQAFAKVTPKIQDMIFAKISGRDELEAILNHLTEEKLLKGALLNDLVASFSPEEQAPFNNQYCLTMKGWDSIRTESEKTNTNKVFIATSFQWEKDNGIRLEVIERIKKACSRLGWNADIVSQAHTDYITDKILSEIKSAKFVVAELTYHNRGVYFESGYARGLGKNVFHIVHKDFTETKPEADAESKKMHFDIQQVQYRKWETPEDVEEKLYDWINSTVGKYEA